MRKIELALGVAAMASGFGCKSNSQSAVKEDGIAIAQLQTTTLSATSTSTATFYVPKAEQSGVWIGECVVAGVKSAVALGFLAMKDVELLQKEEAALPPGGANDRIFTGKVGPGAQLAVKPIAAARADMMKVFNFSEVDGVGAQEDVLLLQGGTTDLILQRKTEMSDVSPMDDVLRVRWQGTSWSLLPDAMEIDGVNCPLRLRPAR